MKFTTTIHRGVVAAVLLLLAFFAPLATAKETRFIDHHQRSVQQSLAQWILRVARDTITPDVALEIVNQTYKQAKLQRVDPLLILAIMRHESTFKPNAKSSHGAVGLMQVVPRWHRDKIRKRSLLVPAVGIEVGTQVLAQCLDKHKNDTPRSLNCYRGGYDAAYHSRIRNTYASARQVVVMSHFTNSTHLTAVHRFDVPRLPDLPIELAQLSEPIASP